jgi:hypothetical protein
MSPSGGELFAPHCELLADPNPFLCSLSGPVSVGVQDLLGGNACKKSDMESVKVPGSLVESYGSNAAKKLLDSIVLKFNPGKSNTVVS